MNNMWRLTRQRNHEELNKMSEIKQGMNKLKLKYHLVDSLRAEKTFNPAQKNMYHLTGTKSRADGDQIKDERPYDRKMD